MRIKSSWELALEKTADIQFDEEKYKEQELVKEGMVFAGKFLNNDQISEEELRKNYRPELKKGITDVIFSNITLPKDDGFSFRLNRISQLCGIIDSTGQSTAILEQISNFFSQYLTARQQFADQMQEQIKQAIQENPQEVNSRQYTQLIEQKLKQMENQYGGALNNFKEMLRGILQ